jgi:hypothetical protein
MGKPLEEHWNYPYKWRFEWDYPGTQRGDFTSRPCLPAGTG